MIKQIRFLLLFYFSGIYCSDYKIITNENKVITLSKNTLNQIIKKHSNLNESPLFNVVNLKNKEWLKEEAIRRGGEVVNIETEEGFYIPCTYFNKHSNKIIVMGTGFGNSRNKLLPLLEIFPSYDVLFIGYWGKEGNYSKDKSQTSLYKNPPNIRYFAQRFRREANDVKAAVRYVRNKLEKKYRQVIGLGMCYSSYTFSKAQAEAESNQEILFDKLIFDSSWYSARAVGDKIAEDPFLSWNFAYGGTPGYLKIFSSLILLKIH